MYRMAYGHQLQLFGSKVILAATREKTLFVPVRTWESRGSFWPQFDWSKEKTIQNIPVKCVCWSARRSLATENQKQNITRPLNKMTQMITTPSIIDQKVGGMGVFSSGELDQIYLAKMATDRSKKQTETNVWTHNWKIDPRCPTNQPKISEHTKCIELIWTSTVPAFSLSKHFWIHANAVHTHVSWLTYMMLWHK